MTEQEWLEATDPEPMLACLRATSDRKLRLFAVACLRRVSGLFPNAALREAIDRKVVNRAPAGEEDRVARALWQRAQAAFAAERCAQAALLRDIIGNPCRPQVADRAWLTPEVVYLAGRVYEEKAFEWMPELAETLAEAGCHDEDVLRHCREQGGVHARGCWVLDLLLDKS